MREAIRHLKYGVEEYEPLKGYHVRGEEIKNINNEIFESDCNKVNEHTGSQIHSLLMNEVHVISLRSGPEVPSILG